MTARKKLALASGVLLLVWLTALGFAFTAVGLEVPVSLPMQLSVTRVGDDYVLIRGTWTLVGDAQAHPVQTSEIQCDRATALCYEATAQVQSGTLRAHLETYDIATWTSSQVVFTNLAPLCVEYVYTVDLLTETVAGRRTLKRNAPSEDCSYLNAELRLSLVNGFDLTKEARREALPWYGSIALAPVRALLSLF